MYVYRVMVQSAVAGTLSINGFSKGIQGIPDVNQYTTETDGSRIYNNPKKNNRPLSALQAGYTTPGAPYNYTADSPTVFCREQGFYQAVVIDQETTTEMLTQWDSTANNWSTAPGAATGGTSTKNVWPTPAGARVKSLKCSSTSPAQ